MRFLSAFALLASLLPLSACQSGAMGGAQFQKMAAEQNALLAKGGPEAKEMSDKERDELLATADQINAEAPALAAASMFGGLDPTGITQSAVWGEQMRQAQKVQAHMPAMMADARFQLESHCKAHPNSKTCLDWRKLQAEMRRQGH